MKIKIKDLLEMQQEVNEKVNEKVQRTPEGDDYLLAFNTELFEYLNAVGTWKWWKHSHQINREKILDELADCFAFFLSVVDYENNLMIFDDKDEIVSDVETELNEVYNILVNHQKKVDQTTNEIINDLAKYIGTDNEIKAIPTVERFAIAIFISTALFEGITWDEITDAYYKKSNINIQRQVENY